MEPLGAVASIGTILSGLRGCYWEIQDIRLAWRHGPSQLEMFALEVRLFKTAIRKVRKLVSADPEYAKNVFDLGKQIWTTLESFLTGFRKRLPALHRSWNARNLTRFKWYFQKKTAESLLNAISRGEVCLNVWLGIDMLQSRDKRIEILEEKIRQLELLRVPVSDLRDVIVHLRKEKSELKKQCRRQIRKIKYLQKEHKADLRKQRDHDVKIMATDMVDQFLSETLEPLIQANAIILELDKRYRRTSSTHHPNHSGSGRRTPSSRRMPPDDLTSRSSGQARDTSTRAASLSRRTEWRSDPLVRSVKHVDTSANGEKPLASLRNSKISRPTSWRHGLENSSRVADQKLQDIRLEHTTAGRTSDNVDSADGDKNGTLYEKSISEAEGGGIAVTEAVEEPRAHIDAIDCSPRLKTNHSVNVETTEGHTLVEDIMTRPEDNQHAKSIEVIKETTEVVSYPDTELHEYRRKIEQKSNEHTDNIFRNKRVSMLKKQEEAEARFLGRPKGREEARDTQSRTLGSRRYLERERKPSRSSDRSS